jgi:hypothetical protein
MDDYYILRRMLTDVSRIETEVAGFARPYSFLKGASLMWTAKKTGLLN